MMKRSLGAQGRGESTAITTLLLNRRPHQTVTSPQLGILVAQHTDDPVARGHWSSSRTRAGLRATIYAVDGATAIARPIVVLLVRDVHEKLELGERGP